MKFNLSVHIVEVQREENQCKCSLANYVSFIKLSVDFNTHLPQWTEGVGKEGPPYQTTKHNALYLEKHFPTMRKAFADGISEEVNFKFKDITPEMVAQLNVKKEEKDQTFIKRSKLEKKSNDSVLDLLDKVLKATKIGSLFDTIDEKTPKEAKQNLNLRNLNSQENFDKKAMWHNADQIMSKLKMSHLRPIELPQKIAV